MKSLSLIIFALILVGEAAGQQSRPDDFWSAAQVRHATGTATVVLHGPRPLWMALLAVEREYGWLVDYEDPIYQEATESVVQHNLQWDTLHPGVPSRVPAGTTFSSTYPEDSQTPASTTQRQVILAKIVSDYNASANPGRFELRVAGPGRINIVGYSRHAPAGRGTPLDSLVTIKTGTRGAVDALQELADALTKTTGIKVVVGAVPWNLLVPARVSTKAERILARSLLTDIADSANVPLMWDFLYDFDTRSYFLSLRPRSRLVTDAAGKRVLMPQ
jgi:hypothetical protein